jgi:hypothetical protein
MFITSLCESLFWVTKLIALFFTEHINIFHEIFIKFFNLG